VKFRLREQERKNEEKRRRSSNKRHKKNIIFLLFSLKIKEISIFLDNLSTFCEK